MAWVTRGQYGDDDDDDDDEVNDDDGSSRLPPREVIGQRSRTPGGEKRTHAHTHAC